MISSFINRLKIVKFNKSFKIGVFKPFPDGMKIWRTFKNARIKGR